MKVERRQISMETQLSPADACFFIEIAERLSGVQITPEQVDFLTLRVRRRMRLYGDKSFSRYIYRVKANKSEETELMESLVTHTTAFFREPRHYSWLKNTGLHMITERRRSAGINVWSAACSSGPELWSAAMEIARFQESRGRTYSGNLVGTDVSSSILRRARTAIFSEAEISSITPEYQKKYLRRSTVEIVPARPRYRIGSPLLESAEFVKHNLISPSPPNFPKFDLAFFRNVLIYFKKDDQQIVFDNVLSQLRTGGILLLGHTETLSIDTSKVKRIAAAIYIKE